MTEITSFKLNPCDANKIDLMIRKIMSDLKISHVDAVKVLVQSGVFMYGYIHQKGLEDDLYKYVDSLPPEVSSFIKSSFDFLMRINEEFVERKDEFQKI